MDPSTYRELNKIILHQCTQVARIYTGMPVYGHLGKIPLIFCDFGDIEHQLKV